jgi:hypothetical protein
VQPNCSFSVKQTCPIDVPPGDTVNLLVELEILGPGPFRASQQLFLDTGGVQAITLLIQGEAEPGPQK